MPTSQHITSVEFRDVVGFPGYRVGSDGFLWSRHVKDTWRPLITSRHPSGYRFTHLKNPMARGYCRRYVHRLVLEAFVGPCPPGMQCCHYDGDKSNNAATNLRWDTRRANMLDLTRHGRPNHARGSKAGNAKLRESNIPKIRRLFRSGLSMGKIARRFHVSSASISQVISGKTWSHVPG